MAEAFNVHNLSCSVCLQQGYRCAAYQFDGENGPVCVFHLDGDACPHKNGIRVAVPTEVPAKPRHEGHSALRAVNGRIEKFDPHPPVDLPAPKLEPIQPKEKPMPLDPEAPLCKAPGCEARTNSKVGYCAKHYFLSETKNHGEPGTCTVCGITLRRDNRNGLCKEHRGRTHARIAKPKKSAKPRAEATNGRVTNVAVPDADPARINVRLNEQQIDSLLTRLPLADKAAILNTYPASN
jgi:hypothetical protein